MNNPLKIIQLKAENIKRIKAIEINPVDNTVIISGENGEGKSSVLDAIWLALDVKSAGKNINQPIRNGEDKAKSVIDLGDIRVTRTWTQKGTYLKVEPKEIVSKYGGAQSVLDAFIGKLSFDPMEFIKLPDKEQRDMLLKLTPIGIDLDAWEVKRKQVYDERTDVNRQVKEYQIKIDNVPAIPVDTPTEEIKIQELIQETQQANEVLNAYEKAVEERSNIFEQIENLKLQMNDLTSYIDKVKLQGVPDPTVLQHQLDTATEINKNVRFLQQYLSDKLAFETHQKNADTLTSHLEQMDKQKSDAIKNANFPIQGLGFSDSGVTYNDIPISKEIDSQGIMISMSIAMALNPNLKVILIKNGSLLDKKNFELVKQMVKDKDYQLWIECVDDTGKLGIVIEDGQVKSNEPSELINTAFQGFSHDRQEGMIDNKQLIPDPDNKDKFKDGWF